MNLIRTLSDETLFEEKANPSVVKVVNKLIKSFKREYASTFRGDLRFDEPKFGGNTAEITLHYERFLSDSRDDRKDFDTMSKELQQEAKNVGATKVDDNSFFAGPIAGSLIKRGKTIDADALLSYVALTLTFPVNFKR